MVQMKTRLAMLVTQLLRTLLTELLTPLLLQQPAGSSLPVQPLLVLPLLHLLQSLRCLLRPLACLLMEVLCPLMCLLMEVRLAKSVHSFSPCYGMWCRQPVVPLICESLPS
jgi:hypothetical protein